MPINVERISPQISNQPVVLPVAGIERNVKDMDLGGPAPIGQSLTITETGTLTETGAITEPQRYTRVPAGGKVLAEYI